METNLKGAYVVHVFVFLSSVLPVRLVRTQV